MPYRNKTNDKVFFTDLEDTGSRKSVLVAITWGHHCSSSLASAFCGTSEALELLQVIFGDYCPVILTFSRYNLAKSSKHSLGDICASDEKHTRKINNFGIEVRSDKIL